MPRVALGAPKRVWVENDHVYLSGHDGSQFWMEPEVAVKLSRMLGTAGGDALIHKVMDPKHFDCDPTGNGRVGCTDWRTRVVVIEAYGRGMR